VVAEAVVVGPGWSSPWWPSSSPGPMLTPTPTLIYRRLADKYYLKRINQALEEQFREMGLCSIVITVFTQADGKLNINV